MATLDIVRDAIATGKKLTADVFKDCHVDEHEYIFRNLIKEKLKSQEIDDFESYVDYVVDLAKQEIIRPFIPLQVVEDLIDAAPLRHLEQILSYMENRNATWTKAPFKAPLEQNRLLRLCNSLQRRLSRSQNTALCGRILMLLASIFPLCDKSGVNLRSTFNQNNKTAFIQAEEELQEQAKQSDTPIDTQLYKSIWTVQEFFHAPLLCYQPREFATMQLNMNRVLDVFGSMKTQQNSKKSSSPQKSQKVSEDAMDVDKDSSKHVFFAKFLTSPKLFQLQISDALVRRQMLTEILILFQYLETQTPFKAANHVLVNKNKTYINQTRDRIFGILKHTGEDGDAFVASVKAMLKAEKRWIQWKSDGCKNMELKPPESSGMDLDEPPMKRPKRDTSKFDLGSNELSRLWNISHDDLEACKNPKTLSATKEFFEDTITQLDPKNNIEKQYWNIEKPKFVWQATRYLWQRELPRFGSFEQSDSLSQFLETTIRDIGGIPAIKKEEKPTSKEAMDTSDDKKETQNPKPLPKKRKHEESEESETKGPIKTNISTPIRDQKNDSASKPEKQKEISITPREKKTEPAPKPVQTKKNEAMTKPTSEQKTEPAPKPTPKPVQTKRAEPSSTQTSEKKIEPSTKPDLVKKNEPASKPTPEKKNEPASKPVQVKKNEPASKPVQVKKNEPASKPTPEKKIESAPKSAAKPAPTPIRGPSRPSSQSSTPQPRRPQSNPPSRPTSASSQQGNRIQAPSRPQQRQHQHVQKQNNGGHGDRKGSRDQALPQRHPRHGHRGHRHSHHK